MKYIKFLIFTAFVVLSFFVIFEHLKNSPDKNISIDYIIQDDNVVDIANILTIKDRVSIKELLDTIWKTTGVKILFITLNDSVDIGNQRFSEFLLQKWSKENKMNNLNSLLIAIFKKNPEIFILFTEDLDYVMTKDIVEKSMNVIESGISKADNYMKLAIKEGNTSNDRYKDFIGEGVVSSGYIIKEELEKAILTISKAEFELKNSDINIKDNRIEKIFIDNTIYLSLIFSFLFLIAGLIIYYFFKNRCPQCGNRMIKQKNIISYPKDDIPGIREINFSCIVCGFTNKERTVFFEKKLFFKGKKRRDKYSQN